MEELDNRWILVDSKSHCPEGNSAPATLGLTNMAGQFHACASACTVDPKLYTCQVFPSQVSVCCLFKVV